MKSNKVVYSRDESKMHNAPEALPIVMAIEIIILIVSVIYIVFSLISKNTDSVGFTVFSILGVFCIVHGTFCDYFYNWYENVRYEVESDGKVTYFYYLNDCAMSANKEVRIKLNKITKYKLKGKKKIVLYGEFNKRAPMKKPQELNKVVLQLDLGDNREKVMKAIETVIERS